MTNDALAAQNHTHEISALPDLRINNLAARSRRYFLPARINFSQALLEIRESPRPGGESSAGGSLLEHFVCRSAVRDRDREREGEGEEETAGELRDIQAGEDG